MVIFPNPFRPETPSTRRDVNRNCNFEYYSA